MQIIFFFIAVIIIILSSFRPFSSIYRFNERDDVCLNFFIFILSSFLGDEVVSGAFLLGLFQYRLYLPFIVLIALNFLICHETFQLWVV